MLDTYCVVIIEARSEGVTRSVEPLFQFTEHEVAVDQVSVFSEESTESADGGDMIARKALKPGQVVRVVVLVRQQRFCETSTHRCPQGGSGWRHDLCYAEVRRVAVEPDSEKAWSVLTHATSRHYPG